MFCVYAAGQTILSYTKVCLDLLSMSELSLYERLLQSEFQRLNEVCRVWRDEERNNANLPEHVRGLIRSAIGKAHLLVQGKLKQFRGLIEVCENGCGEKTVTVSDLQGYWDLVCIEIADVNSSFLMLERLKNNTWIEVQEAGHETTRPPLKIKKVKTSVSKTSGCHSAAAKKRLAEVKKEMKAPKNDKADSNDTMLFEIPVFFSLRSPVKGSKEATVCKGVDKQGDVPAKKTKTPIKDYSPLMHVTREMKKTILSKEN